MKTKQIVAASAALFLFSCGKGSTDMDFSIIPKKGAGIFLLGGDSKVTPPVEGVFLIDDDKGLIHSIYITDHKYSMLIDSFRLRPGDNFGKLPDTIKESLQADSTSDKLKGDWYKSDLGFSLCVENGKIMGIGISDRN